MGKKLAATDIPIHRIATTTSTALIATHGLSRAYEISKRIQEQILSHVKRQITRHPSEWSDKIKREISGQSEVEIPAIPVL